MNPEARMNSIIPVQKKLQAYAQLLQHILDKGWWILPLGIVADCDEKDKVMGIVHTTEGDLDTIKEIAIMERVFKVVTSYTIPPAMTDMYEFIVELGHEPIAMFPIFQPALDSNRSPSSILMDNLLKYQALGSQPDGIYFPPATQRETAHIDESLYFSEYSKERPLIFNMPDGEQTIFKLGVRPMIEFGLSYVTHTLPAKERVNDQDKENLKKLNEVIETGTGKTLCSVNPQTWEV